MDTIHICFATDNNYIQHTGVTIASILSNASKNDCFVFHIISDSITEKDKLKIEALKNLGTFEARYPMPPSEWQQEFLKITRASHVNITTYLKLFIPQLCPDVDKVLYLDSDLIVLTSLADLYHIKMEDQFYFYGCPDQHGKDFINRLGYSHKYSYINTGVLLVNCRSMRKNMYFDKLYHNIKSRYESYILAEQDIINDIFHDKIYKISLKWNMHITNVKSIKKKNSFDSEDLKNSIEHPSIIHYISKNKPWLKECNHPDKELYWKYIEQTPWCIKNQLAENGAQIISAFPEKNSTIVVFSCDKNFVKYLSVSLTSIVYNSSEENVYDIFILENDLDREDKDIIHFCVDKHQNISLKFVNVKYLEVLNSQCFTTKKFTLSTYYRLFASSIFINFDKIVYIDADTVCMDDISNLFYTHIGTNLIGACRDYIIMRGCYTDKDMNDYIKNKIKISDPYNYFNAGILICNLKEMRRIGFESIIKNVMSSIDSPKFVDQDILNIVCNGKVIYIDGSWNNTSFICISSQWDMEKDLPHAWSNEYQKIIENPIKIIHYCGHIRPWFVPHKPLARYFWHYARLTPLYEQLLAQLAWSHVAASAMNHLKLRIKPFKLDPGLGSCELPAYF